MFVFGDNVLARFPFTDLPGDKRRPALVVSANGVPGPDVIVCFIMSVLRSGPGMVPIAATPGTGLKRPSVVRFDKIAKLDRSILTGRLGTADPAWPASHRGAFYRVFGFPALTA